MKKARNILELRSYSDVIRKKLQYARNLQSVRNLAKKNIVELSLEPSSDPWRFHRLWRFMFGLIQDTAGIKESKGFRKQLLSKGDFFTFGLEERKLRLFLDEAWSLAQDKKLNIFVDGERQFESAVQN